MSGVLGDSAIKPLVIVDEVHMYDVRTSDPVEQIVTRRVMRAVVEREPVSTETE